MRAFTLAFFGLFLVLLLLVASGLAWKQSDSNAALLLKTEVILGKLRWFCVFVRFSWANGCNDWLIRLCCLFEAAADMVFRAFVLEQSHQSRHLDRKLRNLSLSDLIKWAAGKTEPVNA